ncbi:MAG: hypothetical protein ACMUIP_06420 [bacterium]
MGKKDFKRYICRPFCMFFREGAKEDMACRGAQVVEALVRNGQLSPDDLPSHGKDPCLWQEHDTSLERILCHGCPFYANDCDYQSKDRVSGLEPCGGYILISLLKRNGSLSEADLVRTTHE